MKHSNSFSSASTASGICSNFAFPGRSKTIARIALLVAPSLALAACATDTPPPPSAESGVSEPNASVPVLLEAEFEEEFRIEALFGRIEAMRFAAGGELVVLDRQLFTVFVYDRAGEEIHAWGRQGEGPGEFSGRLGGLAVSHEGRVAVSGTRRIDEFDLAGRLLGSHDFPRGPVADIAYDAEGNLLVRTRLQRPYLPGAKAEQVWTIVRLHDDETLWSFDPMPSMIQTMSLFTPSANMEDLGGGEIVVGVSDAYDLSVLDASTGDVLGILARDVAVRGPDDAYIRRTRERLRARGNRLADMISFEEAFPLTGRVFAGPPGRSYWVLRQRGLSDALSPPLGNPRNGRVTLFDLFSSRDHSYIGTVRAPEGLSVRAGDGNRIAGVFTDELGVETVRAMRLLAVSETTQP